MKFFSSIFFVLFFSIIGNSQIDFQEIDDYVRSTKFKTKDFAMFTQEVTKKSNTDLEKVRAIFVWITDNVKYNDKLMDHKTRKISADSAAELEDAFREVNKENIQRTIQKRKGVCEDYAQLFQEMCTVVGIESEFVVGHDRQHKSRVGKLPKRNGHAWNSVKIDDKWYLLDATWAAGHVTNGKFKRKFREGYFLVKPEDMIKSHLPKEEKFQYLDAPITKEAFSEIPVIHYGYHKLRVQKHIPQQAIIPVTSGTVKFEIQIENDDLLKGFFTLTGSKIKPLEFEKVGEDYVFEINVSKKKNRKITIVAQGTDGEFDEVLTYVVK